jgi:hypothetical protein
MSMYICTCGYAYIIMDHLSIGKIEPNCPLLNGHKTIDIFIYNKV